MAESWHVEWLSEGVEKWNRRRRKVKFSPDLSGVKFFNLLPPDFRDSPKTSRYFEKIDLSDSNLAGADLSGLNFYKAKFANSDLSDADMSRSNFIEAKFKNADLSRATFFQSLFDKAIFENSNLQGVSFEGVGLDGALFVGSNVSGDQIAVAESHSAEVFSSRQSYRRLQASVAKEKLARQPSESLLYEKVAKYDESTKKNSYDVFFGTNRNPVFARGALADFGGNLHSELSYGVCEVFVPEGHRMGSLGSPLWRRILNKSDDRLKVSALIYLNEVLFWKLIRDTSDRMKIKERPTIFVHGFNNTFQQAVLRAAQIGFDLGLGQGIGLFSWPSKGNFLKYSADEAASEASKYELANYIEKFVRHSNQKSINIIAHSMGCRSTLGAIEVLSSGRKSVLKSINQVILAAADVDAAIMPHLGAHAVKYAARTTSYISNRDAALKVSGWLHNFPRVGVTPPTFILEGMDTILVNDLDLGEFAHNYVGTNRIILSDIFDLLKTNSPPEDRHAIEAVSLDGRDFWRIKN